MEYKAGAIWAGYQAPWDKIAYAITIGQQYLMENTTLGIPAIMQSEGEISLSYGTFSQILNKHQVFTGSRIMGQYGHPQSVLPRLSTLHCCKRLPARSPQKQKGWVFLSCLLLFSIYPANFGGVEWKRILVKTLSCTSSLPSPCLYDTVTNKFSEQVRWVMRMSLASSLGVGAMSATQRLLVWLQRANTSQLSVAHKEDCEFNNRSKGGLG